MGRGGAEGVTGGGISDWREVSDSEFVGGGGLWGFEGDVLGSLCVWRGGGG